jgi:hypothetical protein
VFGHTSSIAFPEAERTVGDREFGRDGQPAPLQVEQPSASAFGIVGIGLAVARSWWTSRSW